MTDPTTATQELASLLAGHRYRYTSEAELQATIAHVLREAGYTVHREVSLTPADRIDFLATRWPNLATKRRLEGKPRREYDGSSVPIVGIEAKVKGSVVDVRRQVLRYLESDLVDGLVLVSNKFTHAAAVRVPGLKPVLFACIARAA